MSKQSSRSVRRRSYKRGISPLSVTTLLCTAGSLAAQSADTKPTQEPPTSDEPTKLKDVVVEATQGVYNPQRLQSPKFTEPLRDVPQTITVIPRQVIEERGAFSLRDVLRNTPGISMQAGEGVSGSGVGDNLAIRGFASRSDWYIDGMRDLGTYNRDPFNVEQVEVAKGPASVTNGRGSTGGSINLVTKMAGLEDYNLTTLSVGTDALFRGTVDVNERLSEHTAIRLNGMYHTADTPGRNGPEQERYGIAGSIAFGLGTDTRFTLNYQRFEEDNIPDFGIPWVPTNGTFIGAAAGLNGYRNQPAPVDYDSFYGRTDVDFQRNQGDLITAIFEHDFSDHLKLRNQMRYSRVHYHSVTTAPRFRDIGVGPGNQYNTTLSRETQRRQITNEFFANQTIVTANFDTGPLKHALVTGLELYWERQLNAAAVGISNLTDLYNPDVINPPGLPPNGRDTTAVLPALPGPAEAHLDTISAYIFDTIAFAKYFEFTAGIRYDHLDAEARGTGNGDRFGGPQKGASNTDDLFSWKAALIYKPVDYGSIYFGYATSFNASVDGVLPAGLGLNNGTNQTTNGLDPEETRSMELGTKWDLMSERLSITGAFFRTEKRNARTTAAGVTTLSGELEVEGFEIGLAGQITKNWQIFAGYAHMNSLVNASTNLVEVGRPLPNTPEDTFNLWTTYHFGRKWDAGIGEQYVGEVIGSSANPTRIVPGYWVTDAMLSYQVNKKFGLRLNIYNLADERYIETSSGTGHFIPGPGRSAVLTASVKF